MSQLRSLVSQIHRRSLWQVLGIYAAASWVIYQVVLALYDGIGLPQWVPGTALVLLLIGLPIVLATAFVQEGGPGGGGAQAGAGAESRTHLDGFETAAAPLARGSWEPPAEDPGAPPQKQSPGTPGPRRRALFTWPRAITGGVLAFAALGLATTGFMGMRALGIGPAATLVSSGVLEARAPIVLADFQTLTGDAALARVVTEAFRADLAQSDVIKLANPNEVAFVLERMGRETGTPLDGDLAREVAARSGMKALIAGEVGQLGGRYVLTARVIGAMDGEVLLTLRETARDSTELIPAIDRLAKSTRKKIGESLRSVRRSPYLMAITTPSLPALKKLVQAYDAANRGDDDRALVLLDEAIERDRDFAEAYRKRGAILNNHGRTSEAIAALQKALAHPGRLTDYERYHTRAILANATGDLTGAASEYHALLELNSEDARALNNLGFVYVERGDWDRAEQAYRRAVEALEPVEPGQNVFAYTYTNLAVARWNLGHDDSAAAALARLEAVPSDNPVLTPARADFAAATGDYERAMRLAAQQLEDESASLWWQQWGHSMQAEVHAVRGQLGRAIQHHDDAIEAADARGSAAWAMRHGARIALLQAVVLGDSAATRATLAEYRARYTLDAIVDPPLQPLAVAYALSGQLDSARVIVERIRALPDREHRRDPALLPSAEAALALAEGDYDRSTRLSTRDDHRLGCSICSLPQLGLARELQGEDAAAIEAYTRFLENRYAWRANWLMTADGDGLFRPLVHERLAGLHERRGDHDRAAEHYRAFLDLWQDADPELQPRVRAARRALARLAAEPAG